MNNIQRIEQIIFAIFGKEIPPEKMKEILISFIYNAEGDIISEELKQEKFLKELKSFVLEKLQNKAQDDYLNQAFANVKELREEAIRGL